MATLLRHTIPYYYFTGLIIIGLTLLWKPSQAQSMKKMVEILASDSLNGRGAATIYEKKAAAQIEKWMKDSRFTSLKQSFPCLKDTATNLIYIFNPLKRDSLILLTAHYDHLSPGSKKSKEILRRDQIHNGADDNASGVSVLIHISRQMKTLNRQYGYIIVFYSGHEEGLYGSAYFGKSKLMDSLKIARSVNLDMVGRMNPETRRVGVYSFRWQVNETLKNAAFKIYPYENMMGDGDVVINRNIPFLQLTTGIHEDYHRADDDANKINYKGMRRVSKILVNFLTH